MIPFGDTDRELKVQTLDNFDFAGFDMALFAAGSDATRLHAPRAAKGRLCGDRQLVALSYGPRRAADRAGGEPGCHRRLFQAQHCCQP